MKLRIGRLLAIAAFVCCGLAGARTLAQNAYITNFLSNNVSVIPTTNAVTATITVGGEPEGVAVSPDGSKVYVANSNSDTVSVISTATNRVTATIPVSATAARNAKIISGLPEAPTSRTVVKPAANVTAAL